MHERCCVRRYLVNGAAVGIQQDRATTKGPAARCDRGDESGGTLLGDRLVDVVGFRKEGRPTERAIWSSADRVTGRFGCISAASPPQLQCQVRLASGPDLRSGQVEDRFEEGAQVRLAGP